jgi:hypothetical protein
VVAQLPRDLKRIWEEGDTSGRKPIKLHRKEFYDRVKRGAGVPSFVRIMRNGANDLTAVRQAGGIVQDPSEAAVPNLPLGALARDGHRVAKIDEIPELLRTAVANAAGR